MSRSEIAIEKLIHILAHHPDITTEEKDLGLLTPYFEFVFETIGQKDNVNAMILACEQMKMVEDLVNYDGRHPTNIYYVADVGISIITRMAIRLHWEITPCTLKMPYPRLIVKRLPKEEASANLAIVYNNRTCKK